MIARKLKTSLKHFLLTRSTVHVSIHVHMSNHENFTISKKVFDGQCAGQKIQMLRVSYENTYIIYIYMKIN